MSVPKKRRTKSSVGKRQSHDALKKLNLIQCPTCREWILPHRVCPYCGKYKGRQILQLEIKTKSKKQ